MTEVTETRWAELIDRVEGSGPDAAAAARTLLEAFIKGSRNRRLGAYIARCLGEYLRDGVPIELALRLNTVLPPVLRGAAGEGDRRRDARSARATEQRAEGVGASQDPDHRQQHAGRGRKRKQRVTDMGTAERRSGARVERRRQVGATPGSDND